MTIRNRILIAAGAALTLALPVAAQAQADQTSAKAYPTCSTTVTDSCMQRAGRGHAKMHHAKPAHHKKAKG